jgi:hypothetical protein
MWLGVGTRIGDNSDQIELALNRRRVEPRTRASRGARCTRPQSIPVPNVFQHNGLAVDVLRARFLTMMLALYDNRIAICGTSNTKHRAVPDVRDHNSCQSPMCSSTTV